MKKVIRFLSAAAFCVVVSAAAYAQEPAAGSQPVDETTLAIGDAPAPADGAAGGNSILPYAFRMILVLALVLAAIYGLYALLKRNARPASREDTYLRVLATTNLAPGRFLHVASLGTRAWLVGSTDSSVTLIAEVEDKELIDTLELKAQASPEAPRKDFASFLNVWLKPKAGSAKGRTDASDFFSRQRDRLKKF